MFRFSQLRSPLDVWKREGRRRALFFVRSPDSMITISLKGSDNPLKHGSPELPVEISKEQAA